MKDADLKIISEHLDGSIGGAVEKYVNGHLREVKSHLERQDEKLETMSVKLDALACDAQPIIESKNTIINLRRFIIWVAAPLASFWAFIEFVLKK